jgi:two-component system response regulator
MNEEDVEILLVEDNPNDVELMLHVFKSNRISNRIRVVRDGSEALEFIFCTGAYAARRMSDGPKFILLDLKLPKISGLEVLKQIKSDPRTCAIPVVILTSSHQDRDMVDGYKYGVNSYICKPVDFEQFTEAARMLGMYWLLLNQAPKSQAVIA